MGTHRPWVSVAVCFGVGIALQGWLHLSFWLLTIAAGTCCCLSVFFHRSRGSCAFFLLVTFVLLGAMRLESSQSISPRHIEQQIESPGKMLYGVEGTVVSDIQRRRGLRGNRLVFVLEVSRWQIQPVSQKDSLFFFKKGALQCACVSTGRVLVNLYRNADLHYGDQVYLAGKLHEPFNFGAGRQFSYSQYLSQKGIQWILSVGHRNEIQIIARHQGNFIKEFALESRERLKNILTRYLSKESAGIINALILGERYDIASDIKDLFLKTGTTHILSISGFNVGIVVFLVFLFLNVLRFNRTIQHLGTIVIIVFYAVLTGAQASVVRATIMSVVFLFSFLIEKETDSLNSLALAALIILLINPFDLFGVGFQLSFLSVFFIVTLCPKMIEKVSTFWAEADIHAADFKLSAFVAQTLIVSVVAFLGVLGLIAYYFHIVTPITILANLVIVPLTSLNTALGIGLIVSGSVFPCVAQLFAVCIELSLNLMVMAVRGFSLIPGAYVFLKEVPLSIVCGYYGMLLMIIFWRNCFGAVKGLVTLIQFRKLYSFFFVIACRLLKNIIHWIQEGRPWR